MTEQAMINVIDKMAEKLAVPTTEIMNAYMASGVKHFIPFVCFTVATLLFVISGFICYIVEHKKSYSEYENTIACIFFALIFMFFSVVSSGNAVLWLTNPKAYAITEIVKHLK